MRIVKALLRNRFGRLLLTVIVLLSAATLVITIQRERQKRRTARGAVEQATASPEAKTTITTAAGGGTTATYEVQGARAVAEISPAEAHAKQRGGEAVILDVREARDLELFGRIKGAIHIPLTELHRRRGELPAGKLIVTYAYAGIPAETEAAKVAAAQLAGEYRTAVLKGSARDWIAKGLPVELPKAYREKLEAEGRRDVK